MSQKRLKALRNSNFSGLFAVYFAFKRFLRWQGFFSNKSGEIEVVAFYTVSQIGDIFSAQRRNPTQRPSAFWQADFDDSGFTSIPYTPQQLEQAMHRDELPRPVRTVVTVCGAMRGVGGIDSWGADVERAYQVSVEQDWEFSFCFKL